MAAAEMKGEMQPVRLDPADRARAAEVLTRAFRDDPAYSYIFPDETDRIRCMRALWRAVIGFALVYGEVWTTSDVSGVACWLSPGNTALSPGQMLRTGLALPRALMGFERGARRRALEIMTYLDRLHRRAMPNPHWYLHALGVKPDLQGRGIGGGLLQPVLARADQNGLPCYLETETERNMAFYRQHGFEVLTAETVPGHDLMMWTLARSPQA